MGWMSDEPAGSFPTEMADRQVEIYRRSAGLTLELTAADLAEAAGVDLELIRAVWRAFGLPDVGDSATGLFDPQDVEMFKAVASLLNLGISVEDLVAVARVYGQGFARISEAEQRVFRKHFLDPVIDAGLGVEELDALAPLSQMLVTLLDAPILNAHRRQLDVAIRQLVVSRSDSGTEPHAVGFVDLVGYSGLVANMRGADLSDLVSAFDELVTRVCANAGARVVKLVGDAVLFVAHEPVVALAAAHGVVNGAAAEAGLPEARAGLDYGEVLPIEGDYFGNPVNTAARVVAVARPGTVTVSQTFADSPGMTGQAFTAVGEHDLKGVGRLMLFEAPAASA
ncbi:MAG: adenylate cyclase [Chloroflexota bacterium]|jgi:adenylate cyclase|nr:adenylate cyclase [Chloroflexota bacterium]